MFHLGIVDHVRLNLTRAGANYTVHARAAERMAAVTSWLRVIVLALILAAAVTSVVGLGEAGRTFRIASVVAVSVAFGAFALYIASGIEGRVYAHRVCAHNLWMVCERHRALLTEIQDGLVDRAGILQRRDELVLEMHQAYAQIFPLDERGFETVRQSAEPVEASDTEQVFSIS